MQRTRTIAAAIKKYLPRTSLLHSCYLFSASTCLAFFLSFTLSLLLYSRLCTRVRSFIHSFNHLLVHSLIHSHSFTHSLSLMFTQRAHVHAFSLSRKSYFIFLVLPHHLSTYLHLVITIIFVIVSLYIFDRKSLLPSFFPIMANQSSA